LPVHPFAGLKRLKVDEQERVRYLTPEEEGRLRQALLTREDNLRKARDRFNAWRKKRKLKPLPPRTEAFLDHLRPLTIMAINTGMRRGELLTLGWGSVDFHGKLVTITSSTAKSGKARHIPLNDEALEMLRDWRRHLGSPASHEYVFLGPAKVPMKRINTAWTSLAKLAKLKDFRFHDCRHHFASRLVQGGTDLNVVRELLGHSDIKTTLRYAHLAPGNLRTAVEKIGLP
jgi:integrase